MFEALSFAERYNNKGEVDIRNDEYIVTKEKEPPMTKNIEAGWNFDNSYARLPKSFYNSIDPNPVQNTRD